MISPMAPAPKAARLVRGTLAATVLAAGTFVAALVFLPSYRRDNLLVNTIFIGMLSLVAVGALAVRWWWQRERRHPEPIAVWIGPATLLALALLGGAATVTTGAIWDVSALDRRPWPGLAASAITLGVALVVAAALRLLRFERPLDKLPRLACGLVLATAALSVVHILNETTFRSGRTADFTILVALGVALSSLSAIALPVLWFVAGKRRTPEKPAHLTLAPDTRVPLTCPRCKSHHDAPEGTTPCPTCGLLVHLQLIEPRCPACAYALYGPPASLTTCPECGTTLTP